MVERSAPRACCIFLRRHSLLAAVMLALAHASAAVGAELAPAPQPAGLDALGDIAIDIDAPSVDAEEKGGTFDAGEGAEVGVASTGSDTGAGGVGGPCDSCMLVCDLVSFPDATGKATCISNCCSVCPGRSECS